MNPATIGLIISAISAVYGGTAQKRAADAAADQAEVNATRDREAAQSMAEQEAMDRREQANIEHSENRRRRAAILAAQAKSGTLIGEGSNQFMMQQQAIADEYNTQQSGRDSQMRQLGIKVSGNRRYMSTMAEASAMKYSGRQAMLTGLTKAAGYTYSAGSNQRWW